MSEPELSCQDLVDLVNDYLFDALAPAERARFVEHLTTCPPCTTFLEQMRATIAATGRLDEAALDDHTKHELLETFRAWKSR